jgi:hypothetical protein
MFKLDQAIFEWRRKMISAGIKSSDVLDELESHLREDVGQQMRAGVTVERAFREAVRRVGAAENLNREFAKVRRPAARFSHRTARGLCFATAAFVLVIETWTLMIYEVSIPERVFGIGMVALIAGFIGALPDLNRLLWRGVRGATPRKAIANACNCVIAIWFGLLWLDLLHIYILPMGIVTSVVCWGLVAAGAMTLMVFVFGAEEEALDLWAPAAWQSFELAGVEAARFHHDFIGTEHVLLGLLGEENGKVRKVLENLGVRRETVSAEIEKIVGLGPESHKNRPAPYTPRAKKAFQFAIREAKTARADRAEPEHVLLGLLGGCGGVAAEILTRMGVDAKKVREQVGKQPAVGTNSHE